jgi:hypothetical protein
MAGEIVTRIDGQVGALDALLARLDSGAAKLSNRRATEELEAVLFRGVTPTPAAPLSALPLLCHAHWSAVADGLLHGLAPASAASQLFRTLALQTGSIPGGTAIATAGDSLTPAANLTTPLDLLAGGLGGPGSSLPPSARRFEAAYALLRRPLQLQQQQLRKRLRGRLLRLRAELCLIAGGATDALDAAAKACKPLRATNDRLFSGIAEATRAAAMLASVVPTAPALVAAVVDAAAEATAGLADTALGSSGGGRHGGSPGNSAAGVALTQDTVGSPVQETAGGRPKRSVSFSLASQASGSQANRPLTLQSSPQQQQHLLRQHNQLLMQYHAAARRDRAVLRDALERAADALRGAISHFDAGALEALAAMTTAATDEGSESLGGSGGTAAAAAPQPDGDALALVSHASGSASAASRGCLQSHACFRDASTALSVWARLCLAHIVQWRVRLEASSSAMEALGVVPPLFPTTLSSLALVAPSLAAPLLSKDDFHDLHDSSGEDYLGGDAVNDGVSAGTHPPPWTLADGGRRIFDSFCDRAHLIVAETNKDPEYVAIKAYHRRCRQRPFQRAASVPVSDDPDGYGISRTSAFDPFRPISYGTAMQEPRSRSGSASAAGISATEPQGPLSPPANPAMGRAPFAGLTRAFRTGLFGAGGGDDDPGISPLPRLGPFSGKGASDKDDEENGGASIMSRFASPIKAVVGGVGSTLSMIPFHQGNGPLLQAQAVSDLTHAVHAQLGQTSGELLAVLNAAAGRLCDLQDPVVQVAFGALVSAAFEDAGFSRRADACILRICSLLRQHQTCPVMETLQQPILGEGTCRFPSGCAYRRTGADGHWPSSWHRSSAFAGPGLVASFLGIAAAARQLAVGILLRTDHAAAIDACADCEHAGLAAAADQTAHHTPLRARRSFPKLVHSATVPVKPTVHAKRSSSTVNQLSTSPTAKTTKHARHDMHYSSAGAMSNRTLFQLQNRLKSLNQGSAGILESAASPADWLPSVIADLWKVGELELGVFVSAMMAAMDSHTLTLMQMPESTVPLREVLPTVVPSHDVGATIDSSAASGPNQVEQEDTIFQCLLRRRFLSSFLFHTLDREGEVLLAPFLRGLASGSSLRGDFDSDQALSMLFRLTSLATEASHALSHVPNSTQTCWSGACGDTHVGAHSFLHLLTRPSCLGDCTAHPHTPKVNQPTSRESRSSSVSSSFAGKHSACVLRPNPSDTPVALRPGGIERAPPLPSMFPGLDFSFSPSAWRPVAFMHQLAAYLVANGAYGIARPALCSGSHPSLATHSGPFSIFAAMAAVAPPVASDAASLPDEPNEIHRDAEPPKIWPTFALPFKVLVPRVLSIAWLLGSEVGCAGKTSGSKTKGSASRTVMWWLRAGSNPRAKLTGPSPRVLHKAASAGGDVLFAGKTSGFVEKVDCVLESRNLHLTPPRDARSTRIPPVIVIPPLGAEESPLDTVDVLLFFDIGNCVPLALEGCMFVEASVTVSADGDSVTAASQVASLHTVSDAASFRLLPKPDNSSVVCTLRFDSNELRTLALEGLHAHGKAHNNAVSEAALDSSAVVVTAAVKLLSLQFIVGSVSLTQPIVPASPLGGISLGNPASDFSFKISLPSLRAYGADGIQHGLLLPSTPYSDTSAYSLVTSAPVASAPRLPRAGTALQIPSSAAEGVPSRRDVDTDTDAETETDTHQRHHEALEQPRQIGVFQLASSLGETNVGSLWGGAVAAAVRKQQHLALGKSHRAATVQR